MKFAFAALPLMLLAACQPAAQQESPAPRAQGPQPAAGPVAEQGVPQREAVPASDAAKASNAPGAATPREGARTAVMPERFQGRWAIDEKLCAGAKPDSVDIMVVTDDAVALPRTRAKVTGVKIVSADEVEAQLEWATGGRKPATSLFTLKDGGQTLVRADADPSEGVGFKRCPL